jgi:hypothetical protein
MNRLPAGYTEKFPLRDSLAGDSNRMDRMSRIKK